MNRFKTAKPTGTIKKLREPTVEEWAIIRNAEVLYEYENHPPEWVELLDEDPDPHFVVLETTDGTFFLIAENSNGHGALTIVKGE